MINIYIYINYCNVTQNLDIFVFALIVGNPIDDWIVTLRLK